MPRPKGSFTVPSYRLHKRSGQAVVTFDAKDYYLGKFGTPESYQKYARMIAEWEARGRQGPTASNASTATICQLIAGYLKHCETYYGTVSTRTIGAMRRLNAKYGDTRAADFTPLSLKSLRDSWIGEDAYCGKRQAGYKISRKYINQMTWDVRSMFRWGAANGMISPDVFNGLRTVPYLKRGRSAARENKKVGPVDEAVLQKFLDAAPPVIRAMVELQLFTAARPGEVEQLRRRDLDTSGAVTIKGRTTPLWEYRPRTHKTAYLERPRIIYLGPKAIEVIKPFLKPDPDAYTFTSGDNLRMMFAARRQGAKNRRSRQKGLNFKVPAEMFNRAFRTGTYNHAIRRVCDKLFPVPDRLARHKVPRTDPRGKGKLRWERKAEWRARLGDASWREMVAFQRTHHFHPHQLRHNAATRIRREYGLEMAKIILGHSDESVTEIYAETDVARAREMMAEIG